jgi:hypothetical protein
LSSSSGSIWTQNGSSCLVECFISMIRAACFSHREHHPTLFIHHYLCWWYVDHGRRYITHFSCEEETWGTISHIGFMSP